MISINGRAVSLFATGKNILSAGPSLGIWSLNKNVPRCLGLVSAWVSRVSVGGLLSRAGWEGRNGGSALQRRNSYMQTSKASRSKQMEERGGNSIRGPWCTEEGRPAPSVTASGPCLLGWRCSCLVEALFGGGSGHLPKSNS